MTSVTDPIDLAFVFIGGIHQVLHLAPVAAEISRRRADLAVLCFCGDARTAVALTEVARNLDAPMRVVELPVPWLSRAMARVSGRPSAAKGPLLAAIRWRARHARAIVVPERTSAVLRRMGWRRPLIHFRHGAGDRAPASEARLKAFDLIVVPGAKDVERAVGRGVPASRLRVGGYVKLDYLQMAARAPEPLFANDRPVVIYNPHFDPAISSLGIAREVIARFRRQERYNLVFAPHIRAVEHLSAAARAALESQAVPDRIRIDLDSPALSDMRYVQAADVYLGDMSSQLYEFLARPRPVAFLNAHGVDWRASPRYAGWHLGEVASGADDVLEAVDRAIAGHAQKVAQQRQAVDYAYGDYRGATRRSADILLEFLARSGAGVH